MKEYCVSSKEQFENLPSHHLEDKSTKTVVKIDSDIKTFSLQSFKNCYFINEGEDKHRFEISEVEFSKNIHIKGLKLIKTDFKDSNNIEIKDCEIYNYLMFFDCENIKLNQNIIYHLQFKSSKNITIDNCKTHKKEESSTVIDISTCENIEVNNCKFSGTHIFDILTAKDILVKNTVLGKCKSFIGLIESEFVLEDSKLRKGRNININRNSNLELNKVSLSNIKSDQIISKDDSSNLEINNSPEVIIDLL